MKKIIFLFFFFYLITISFEAFTEPNIPPDSNIIELRDWGSTGTANPRSAFPTLIDWIESDVIGVYFMKNVGSVIITVEDASGMPLYTVASNGIIDHTEYITLPTERGDYTLRVINEEYETVGEFTIN